MITAIIPIDLSRRAKDILQRSLLLASHAEKCNFRIVFGHNNRATKADAIFEKEILKFKTSSIVSITTESKNINSASLRNIAFKKVETPYLILLDVDIFPDFYLFNKYLQKIEKGEKPFYILPCLYLTRYGSKLLTSKKANLEEMKARYYSFSRKEFLHLACPSSITIMKSSDFKKLNGFNEEFEGHGYEDFDFLLRLCKIYKLVAAYPDLVVDKSARSPLFALGFRKYIGELCLETLLKKEMAFHLYHDKSSSEGYYLKRRENYKIFLKEHGEGLDENFSSQPTLISSFVNLCSTEGVRVHDYSILFENKPGHIDRFDTFKKRLRFLLK